MWIEFNAVVVRRHHPQSCRVSICLRVLPATEYKILDILQTIIEPIYLKMKTIHNIMVRLTDENAVPIDFRSEAVLLILNLGLFSKQIFHTSINLQLLILLFIFNKIPLRKIQSQNEWSTIFHTKKHIIYTQKIQDDLILLLIQSQIIVVSSVCLCIGTDDIDLRHWNVVFVLHK